MKSIKVVVAGEPSPPPVPPRPLPPGYGVKVPARLPPSTGPAFYVSVSGSDSNPGTLGSPWRTVQKALDTLGPGQIAYVRRGTYTQNLVMTRAGTPTAPITIRNYPGETVVLRAGSGAKDNNYPLQLQSGAAYVRFRGLVVEGATGPSTANVYASEGAHDIEFSACEDRKSQRQGFFTDRTTSSIQIIDCYIHDNGGSGPPNGDHNLYVEGKHHLIADCLIKNAPNGFDVQIYPSNDGVIVTENTIVGALLDGIILGSGADSTTNNATLIDNVIAFNGRYGISTYWGGAMGTGNVASTNVVWRNALGQLDGDGITYTANTIADPRFVDRVNGNFHLRAGSPAVDTALIGYALPYDLNGTGRPQGLGPDIGAYER
jgi:Right handed beta helix region/Protein of unknown function (DUF1565)